MKKRQSGRSAEKRDISYALKVLWSRYRWPAILWFLAVLILAWYRDAWTKAPPGEIAVILATACMWFAALLIIPVADYLTSRVLSPSQECRDAPCHDLALAHKHRGEFSAAKEEFLAVLQDFPGDQVCYENLIEILTYHQPDPRAMERLIKRARMEVPPSMLKAFKELAEGHGKRTEEAKITEKKKLDVDFIYDSDIPQSVLDLDD